MAFVQVPVVSQFIAHSTKLPHSDNLTTFVANLESSYDFNNLIFISESADAIDDFNLDDFKKPKMILGQYSLFNFTGFASLMNLYIFCMEDDQIFQWQIVEENSIHMIRHGKVIVYDIQKENRKDAWDHRKVFDWFWSRKILQTVIIKLCKNGTLNAFGYNPFPTMQVFIVELKQPFHDVVKDLRGFPIKSFVLKDPPRAFQYRNARGVKIFGGYGAKIMHAFLAKHNGKLIELQLKNHTYMDGFLLNELFSKNQLDITMHPYVNPFKKVKASYPVVMVDIGVLIPAAQEISLSLYNIFPFNPMVWCLLLIYIAYVTLATLFARTLHKQELKSFKMFLYSIGTVVAVVPPTLPEEFRNQFLPVCIDDIFQHRDNLNTSFGYLLANDRATFLLEKQKNFARPLFKTKMYRIFTGNMMFLMEYFSPYQESLDRVIMQCFQSGLFEKWLKDAYDEAVLAGISKRIVERESKYKPLTVEYFYYFLKFWYSGLIVALIVFLIEIMVRNKLQKPIE